MRIHISNLHGNIIEADLQHLFCFYGEVASVLLMRDRLNNRSLCHGYIEMPVTKEAEQAVISLDQTFQKGKRIAVEVVRYYPGQHAQWSDSAPDGLF